MSARPTAEHLPWTEVGARLRALLADQKLEPDPRGRTLVGAGIRLVPPAALPLRGRDADTYLAELPDALGTQLIVLLQAGAAALGLWHDDDLVRHKTIRKYVVRGRGRAQPTHLATRGKSRYGSRLRLQNARALLAEINERCAEWSHDEGSPDLVLYGCPVRLWSDLFEARPPPPFDRRAAHPVGVHVHRPTFEELLRVRRTTLRGTLERDRP